MIQWAWIEGVLPWANGWAQKPCWLQEQFKEEGKDFLESIWWSQNKWLLWFSWENIIAFFHYRDLWCNWPDSVLGDLGQDSKRLGRVLQPLKLVAQLPRDQSRGRGGSGFGQEPPLRHVNRSGFWQIKDGSCRSGRSGWCQGMCPKLSVNSGKAKMHMDNIGSAVKTLEGNLS